MVQVAHDLARHQELLAARQVQQVLQEQRQQLEDCSGRVEAAAVAVLLARAVRAVLEVAALVVAAVAQHAVHTPLALVVSAVMAGHWWWSSDYGSLCRC